MTTDCILHSPEYDATALPVQDLLKAMQRPTDLVGKRVRIKATGEVGMVITGQWVWGYNKDGKYTTVDGVRVATKKSVLRSLPYPLNEIEVVEDSDCSN